MISVFAIVSIAVTDPREQLPYLTYSIAPRVSILGEDNSLSVGLYSGAALYNYEIKIPQGTNDLSPKLSLFYNSHSTFNEPSVVGNGWQLSKSYIKRNTNYTMFNLNDDKFELVLDGSNYDLIYVDNEHRFHTKIETFIYMENKSSGNNTLGQYWILKTKDGTTYRFGYNNDSELISNQSNFTTVWSLDLINDTYDNSIYYQYKENPFPKDIGAVYLDKILYNNDRNRTLELLYESNDRSDLWAYYDQGNKIQESRRLNEILVKANNSLIKRYQISYNNLTTTKFFISQIKLYGSDNLTFLPPVNFSYYGVKLNWTDNNMWLAPNCTGSSGDSMAGCSVENHNYDFGIRYVDVNGDGRIDIMRASKLGVSYPYVITWINNGSGFVEGTKWKSPDCADDGQSGASCFVSGFGDEGVRLVDVNGDGLVDIVRSSAITGGPFARTWINNGSGWTRNDNWTIPECTGTTYGPDIVGCFVNNAGKDNGVMLIDVNNDGLPDIVRASAASSPYAKTWINSGSGWVNDTAETWKVPECTGSVEGPDTYGCLVTNGNYDHGVRLVDVNGDGLPDIIRATASSSPYTRSWINNGSGWIIDTAETWKVPGCTGPVNSEDILGCFSNNGFYDNGVRLADVNGDGLIDIVRASGVIPYVKIWLNNGSGWNEDSKGWNIPECKGPTGSDLIGCFVNSNNYVQGIMLVDANGDGYTDVIRSYGITNGPYVRTWTNNQSKSYLLANITNEFGGVTLIDYQKSTYLDNKNQNNQSDLSFNLWVVANITKNSMVNQSIEFMEYNYSQGFYDFKDKEFRGFGYAEEKRSDGTKIKHYFYQDDSRKGSEYRIEVYDRYSNLFKKTENWFDNSSSTNGYFINLLRAQMEYTYDGSSTNPKIKNTTYGYDNFGNTVVIHYQGDVNAQGDEKFENYEYLYNTNSWIVNKPKHYYLLGPNNSTISRQTWYQYDGLSYNQNATKGDITKTGVFLNKTNNITTRYVYNLFGNLINEINPKNQNTTYVYRIRDSTNTFADRIINAKNQTVNYYYDLGTGNLLAQLNSNNNATNYTYDVFGRIEKEIDTFDSFTYPTKNYTYDYSVTPIKIITHQRETSGTSGTLDIYQFYDGFNRLIQTKKELDNSNQIVQDIFYDNTSRIGNQSNPYIVIFSNSYTSPSISIPRTIFKYDTLDRINNITNPDGTTKNSNYDHWATTVYDENNHKKTSLTDAYGNIYNILEYNRLEIYNTSYSYNVSGELILIKDSQNNTFAFEYDLLGRKTKIIDPDLGTWLYSYDNASNLIRQIDNRNNITLIVYDQLNRVISRNSSTENITYIYDREKNNTLSGTISPTSSINFGYDDRLRKSGELKTMDSINFVTNWTYDSMDRITSAIFYDGSSINYNYGPNGQLSSITRTGSMGIINSISYNEMLQINSRNYSNLANTTYQHNANNFRLTQIKTGNKQDLNYTYDNVGNVLQIGDSVNSRIETMTYDNLDRLITSVKTANSGNNIFNFTYGYNPIGNIMNLTSNGNLRTYNYGTSLIHAPISISDGT